MAYELHIERKGATPTSGPAPIPVEEWCTAVTETEGVRLFAEATHTLANPATGAAISLSVRKGDAEVFFPKEGKWRAVFRWSGNSAGFTARFDPGDRSQPAWTAAVALASRLGAVIRGDEGEVYDLESGEIVDR